jgi:hypothetical protein
MPYAAQVSCIACESGRYTQFKGRTVCAPCMHLGLCNASTGASFCVAGEHKLITKTKWRRDSEECVKCPPGRSGVLDQTHAYPPEMVAQMPSALRQKLKLLETQRQEAVQRHLPLSLAQELAGEIDALKTAFMSKAHRAVRYVHQVATCVGCEAVSSTPCVHPPGLTTPPNRPRAPCSRSGGRRRALHAELENSHPISRPWSALLAQQAF